MTTQSNRNRHHRLSIRLIGYDYTQPGAYFVTVCTKDRECLFGKVVDEEMQLNVLGHIARQCWLAIPDHFPQTVLDEFIVMPNHMHGIIWITKKPDDGNAGATHASPLPPPRGPKRRSIGAIVGLFKSAVTKRINEMCGTPSASMWPRNYYEHNTRDESSLNRIRQYILENPIRWHLDRENPSRSGDDDLWTSLFLTPSRRRKA